MADIEGDVLIVGGSLGGVAAARRCIWRKPNGSAGR